MKKIGFLHTSPLHIATFDKLFQGQDAVELMHLVDEPLLAQAMESGVTADVESQLEAHILELANAGCEQIVCSCSTLGGAAEEVLIENSSILRVDRPMAANAVKNSHVILMVAAIESTLMPTRELLLDESNRQKRPVQIQEIVVSDAWAEFLAGDLTQYYAKIADGVRDYLVEKNGCLAKIRPQIIVFAQASMAPAVMLLSDADLPILTSPELCSRYLLQG